MPDTDTTVSARRWPKKAGPQERGGFILGALRNLDGWADVRTIRRVALRIAADQNITLTAAPGTTRNVLQGLAEDGLCEVRTQGTTCMYRALYPRANASTKEEAPDA